MGFLVKAQKKWLEWLFNSRDRRRFHGAILQCVESQDIVAKDCLLRRKIGVGNLGNRDNQKSQPKSLQHPCPRKDPIVRQARREERWLEEKFPGYAAHKSRVKKLIPFVY